MIIDFHLQSNYDGFMNDDLVVFADEEQGRDNLKAELDSSFWNILVVDDEPQVHQVTKMVLRDLVYNGKKISFLSAYSSQEAKKILKENNDICLALIDVVMEEDDSGLTLVRLIREDFKNFDIRIILRTGQPGFAPEKEVIINYDINDYKEKTELSAQKLTTSVISALRNYEYIAEISALNSKLEKRVAERVIELKEANDKLTKTLSLLQEDQEAGRIMQNKLLPGKKKIIKGYEFSCRFYPSMFLSGDFLDYFEVNDRYVGFYVADVSGHGVSSAIVTVLLKNYIDNALENFRVDNNPLILKPEAVCRKLNEELLREKLDKYLTIFYGIIDVSTGRMHYINCGQYPYPFLLCGEKAGSSVEVIEGKGTPVGLFKNPVLRAGELVLPECFKMMIFSDGVLEVLDQEKTEEKNDYLHSLLSVENPDINYISGKLGLDKRSSFPDDLTFLMIKKEAADG